MEITEIIELLEKLAKKKTRKRGMYDEELFRWSLDSFMHDHLISKEEMLKVSVRFLRSNRKRIIQMGIAIVQELGKTTEEIDNILVKLFNCVSFSSELFREVRYLIWKYKIKKALPYVIAKYRELKNYMSRKLKNKDSMLSTLAQCAYEIDQKKGARIMLDVIKWDYVYPKDSLYTHTAVFFDNLLDGKNLSVLDPILEKVNKQNDEIKKYVLEESKKGLSRTIRSQDEINRIINYIANKLSTRAK